MKKQKNIVGAIIKINLSENKIVFGKLLKEFLVVVYDKVVNQADLININLGEVVKCKPLLFIKTVITHSNFEIIGHNPVTQEEIRKIPPRFSMETAHPELCNIMYGDGTDRKALPSECVGLDFSYLWDKGTGIALSELIEDRLAGRPNKYEELKRKELEQGIAIEEELGMKIPWEGWKYNPDTKIMGYNSLVGHPATEWRRIVEASSISK